MTVPAGHTVVLAGLTDALDGALSHERPGSAVTAAVRRYATATAALAVQQYRAERAAAGVTGRFTPTHAPAPPLGRLAALIGWAVQPLHGDQPDPDAAQTRLVTGASRLVLNAGRYTIIGNVHRDPKAHGWLHVAHAGSCAYCTRRAASGVVPRGSTARFGNHDACRCYAQPVFAPH